jgi:hypothetical protein
MNTNLANFNLHSPTNIELDDNITPPSKIVEGIFEISQLKLTAEQLGDFKSGHKMDITWKVVVSNSGVHNLVTATQVCVLYYKHTPSIKRKIINMLYTSYFWVKSEVESTMKELSIENYFYPDASIEEDSVDRVVELLLSSDSI